MNDNVKTSVYVGLALVCAVLGYAALPRTEVVGNTAEANQNLFPEFKDPLAASSLEIKKFDEKLGEIEDFKVAKVNDSWVIPSHDNYPADAQKQLAEAAGALLDLKSDGIATEIGSEHALYGVLEPSAEKTKVGAEGVGTLVVMEDGKDNDLVRLIIGKQVKGTTDQYFVRRPGQDIVYVTKIAADKLTTDFDKWIEKDLLKLNGWDVAKMTLKDYTVLLQQTGLGQIGIRYDQRMDATVSYDDAQSKWAVDKFTLFARGKPVSAELSETEELNNQALSDMKFAVDDLKIVNVVRKPKGLGASLMADEKVVSDPESQRSLVEMGFYPLKNGDNYEILAANGEAHVSMKDGVEYVLRFGNIAEATKGSEEGKLNRYLFVAARLNEKQLPAPQLEEEPAEPAGPAAEPKSETPKDGAKGAQGETGEKADAGEKQDEDKAEDSKGQGDDARRAERERIRKANQRKTDEYNDKVKKAKAKVTELNARFADWYYVVSEDTYKKIHLGRNDLVKEGSKAKEEGFGPDAFRTLEKQGLGAKK